LSKPDKAQVVLPRHYSGKAYYKLDIDPAHEEKALAVLRIAARVAPYIDKTGTER
jgi:hypothetical protein